VTRSLSPADARTLQDHLQQADEWVGKCLAEDSSPSYRARLESARVAVRDALRRANDRGDPVTILASLDGVWISDTRRIENIRVLCRSIVRKAPTPRDAGSFLTEKISEVAIAIE
jgi:hypothetical protein